jgi:hypothetical protein
MVLKGGTEADRLVAWSATLALVGVVSEAGLWIRARRVMQEAVFGRRDTRMGGEV